MRWRLSKVTSPENRWATARESSLSAPSRSLEFMRGTMIHRGAVESGFSDTLWNLWGRYRVKNVYWDSVIYGPTLKAKVEILTRVMADEIFFKSVICTYTHAQKCTSSQKMDSFGRASRFLNPFIFLWKAFESLQFIGKRSTSSLRFLHSHQSLLPFHQSSLL